MGFTSGSCRGSGAAKIGAKPISVRGYLRLSAACLTTTFVITQRTGACRRILLGESDELKRRLLPPLVAGESFATVGISHLTTSRRHLAKPVLRAREEGDGVLLEGFSPWVTGAIHAQTVVTGATLDDGRQVLVALPMDLPGVEAGRPADLVGISASHTGPVHCREVFVSRECLLAGPVENVMQQGAGAKTGGLQTSTLAVGLAAGAIAFLQDESQRCAELRPAAESLLEDHDRMAAQLLALADGDAVCSLEDLRAKANSLALRSAQRRWPPPRAAGMCSAIPPAAGAAKRYSFWSGVARSRCWPRTSASWPAWSEG